MIKHIAKCTAISWVGAATLGLIYGARVAGSVNVEKLWYMGIISISLIGSTIMALLITPLTVWAFRPGGSMKLVVPLWIILVAYVLVVTPASGQLLLWMTTLFFLSAAGLVCIRLLTHRKKGGPS
jgi:hypothetical protein